MKNLLPALLLLGTSMAHAQNTGKYCEVSVFNPGFKTYYVATANYGDKTDTKDYFMKDLIKDKDGNKVKFISKVAVVNYMATQGWEMVSSSYNQHTNETHFYMKKE